MAASLIADPTPLDLSSPWLEHAPSPMATVEGATHLVRYVNPAFCRLMGKAKKSILGRSFCDLLPGNDECLAMLDGVYRTGRPASLQGQVNARRRSVIVSYTLWPVMADERPLGVMIQVNESAPLHEKAVELNEALLLGALRQHELTAAAASSNVLLQSEIEARKQNERDAVMLTKEISHRIKNNLQIVVALLANEVRRTPAEYAQGYVATQARIAAIAELYDLMSQASRGPTLPLDVYLRGIAKTMSASLLATTSGISIEVEAAAIDIDPERAVPLGLVVNELGTNAVKHAFPGGVGRVTLAVRQVGEEIELIVADDGVGMTAPGAAASPGRHGSDYVAIFVRQLGGTVAISGSEGLGTVVTIRFPRLRSLHWPPAA